MKEALSYRVGSEIRTFNCEIERSVTLDIADWECFERAFCIAQTLADEFGDECGVGYACRNAENALCELINDPNFKYPKEN